MDRENIEAYTPKYAVDVIIPYLDKDKMKAHLKKVFSHFSSWLANRSPELADHLAQRLENPQSVRWTPPASAAAA